jgi:putative spermidine/putrescine transport system ATP-binding protein
VAAAPSPALDTEQHLVDLVEVHKRFGAVRAVDGVSLHILQGEFFSLLGPSGSGKTTLLNLMGGFEQPTNGRVLIDGRVVNDLPAFRRPVNTVFQGYALFPHMSVEKNVGYPLKMARVARENRRTRILEALEMVGLVGYANRRPHELSGGQRQRVALARALVGRPRVLLLDEPLGALDLQLRQQMQMMLKHLQRTVGITFVYVTHDQGEALSMSDRVAVVSDGKIEQIGTPREIYAKPRTRFVASFIGRTNFLPVQRKGAHWLVAGQQVLKRGAERGPATTLAVRPESIGLDAAADSKDNSFAANVIETVYLGASTRVIIEMATGVRLEAAVPAAIGELPPGQTIRVGWNDADSVLLAD